MKQATPPRSRSDGTVRRRQSRPPQRNQAGNGGPVLLILGVLILIGFWPAMVWHGYGGPTGTAWRWDIHSTIACCIWWAVIVIPVTVALVAKGSANRRLARVAPRLPVPPEPRVPRRFGFALADPPPAPPPVQAAPVCVHPGAVPVDLSTGERVAWLCPPAPDGCGAELPADWKPPPPPPVPWAPAQPVRRAVPVGGWAWNWHCTCGRADSGVAPTDTAAQATIKKGVNAHNRRGHRYEYQYKYRWW